MTERFDSLAREVAILDASIRHERELREQASAAIALALGLQAIEYERRLSDLNHSHERAAVQATRTVPAERFEAYQEATRRETTLALEASNKEIETERNARIRLEGSLGTWRFIAAFLGLPGIVALALGLFAFFGGKS